MRALLAIVLWPGLMAGCARTHHEVDGALPDLPARLDRATEAATRDLPVPDQVRRDLPDLRKVDLAKASDLPKTSDLPKASDLAKLDLKPDSAVCVEAPTINPAGPCAQQCTTPLGDQDCDGLPDLRDPTPHACNALLSFEHFSSSSPSTKWILGTGTGVGFPCGTASLGVGAELLLSQAELAKIPSGKFLVEVKYTLGGAPASSWSVRLKATKPGAPAQYVVCEQWVNTTYATQGGVHMNDNTCAVAGTWSSAVFDTSPGRSYYLQLYSDGTEFACRLAGETGAVDERSMTCALAAPGSLHLSSTRPILVDHVRVFQ